MNGLTQPMKLLMVLIATWQASIAYAAPELKGVWKSNKELTIATFNLPDDMPTDVRDRWCNVFGKMLITWTDNSFATYTPAFDGIEGHSSLYEYRVEIETKDKVIIAVTDPETGEVTKGTLHFVSPDRYYTEWEDMPKAFTPMYGAREYFDRIDPLDGGSRGFEGNKGSHEPEEMQKELKNQAG